MPSLFGVKAGLSIGRGLRMILVAQAVIALFLIGTDILTRWSLGLSFDEPPVLGPVSPGDQVRQYEPSLVRPRFSDPANLPSIDLPTELPNRLEFTLHLDPELGEVLLLNGEIETGDAERLVAFLAGLDSLPSMVALSSPGGTVDEALKIGEELRQRKLETAVLSGMACVSACPYIVAGGTERHISRKGIVGLHQHYYETPGYMPVFFAVSDIQRGQGRTMAYLIEMGVDPGIMVHGLATPPDDIYVLIEEELLESRLATRVVD